MNNPGGRGQKGPTDFNDLHLIAGLDEVAKQINFALSRAQRSYDRGKKPDLPDNSPGDVPLSPDSLPPAPPIDAYADDPQQADQFNPRQADWYGRLDLTEKGAVRQHAGNLERILTLDPRWRGVLAYDDFSYRLVKRLKPPMPDSRSGEWEDADTARLRTWMHRNYLMSPPPKTELQDALIIVAQAHRFHPVRAYLQKLRWDGEKRIDSWLKNAFSAAGDYRYVQACGRMFLIMCVARVMAPGCKADNVLILEGNQGWGKSSAIGELFGDWFSDSPLPIGDKEAYSNIQGIWGYEMAELDAFNKAESTAAKAFSLSVVTVFARHTAVWRRISRGKRCLSAPLIRMNISRTTPATAVTTRSSAWEYRWPGSGKTATSFGRRRLLVTKTVMPGG